MSAIKTFVVRGKEFGVGDPLVCTPIVAKTKEQLSQAMDEMLELDPDVVEWRVDYFEQVQDIPIVLGCLDSMRKKLGKYPIIFTCRIDQEGGARTIPQAARFDLIREVVETRQAEIVDFELCNGEDAIRDILKIAKAKEVRVILSNHDFKKTPPAAEIVERLVRMQELGADVAKIAVMPNSMEDVLALLSATNTMRGKYAKVPLITMAMSGRGLISRVCGGLFGSALTFGAGKNVSAPGQIAVSELRKAMEIFRKNM